MNFESLNISADAEPTTPLSLPGDVLASIYKRLDTKEERHSFFSCCKSIRWCDQVLQLISKTTVHLGGGIFRQPGFRSLDELRHFPRGACLLQLTVRGHKGPGDDALVQLSRQQGPSREKDVLSQVHELRLEGTTIEPTRALLGLCPNLLKLTSPTRPMLFLTHCIADGSVQLPRLQAVHINSLSHKGKIGRHKPMGYTELRHAMQAIESKMGSAAWVIDHIQLIEDAPVHSLSAMEGTSVAAGVRSVMLEVKHPSGRDAAMLARVFPNAQVVCCESTDESDSYDSYD